jgi:hypothetical protein
LSAVGFALEGDSRDYDPSAEAVTLDVNIAPAARICSFSHVAIGASAHRHNMRDRTMDDLADLTQITRSYAPGPGIGGIGAAAPNGGTARG